MVNSFLWIWDQKILCILKVIKVLHLSVSLVNMMKLTSLKLNPLRNKFLSPKLLKLNQMLRKLNSHKKL